MKKSDPTKKPILRAARRAPDESVREEIALAAYSIWEQEGRPEGRNVEPWLQAEVQIRATRDIESCQG